MQSELLVAVSVASEVAFFGRTRSRLIEEFGVGVAVVNRSVQRV
jgi:hypothetical protein